MSPITPDTKDWTWVLERTCPECGFDVTRFPRREIGAMVRAQSEEWRKVLAHPKVRERPSDHTWSALEYACHVRDLFEIFDQRLEMMVTQDGPFFDNWDQDKTAITGRYSEQDPGTVASELETNAGLLADRYDQVAEDEWKRTGRRTDGATFTIESMARYLIHDPVHHLHDVRAGFAKLEATG